MFYYASKIGWFFATPSNLLVSLILLGLLVALTQRWRRLGIGFALAMTMATLALGLLPVANYLLLPLERRFPAFQDDGQPVTGVILLGGSVDSSESAALGQLVANESAERVMDTLLLAARYPQARILISGGGGNVFGEGIAEAPIIAAYFKDVKVEPSRILVEDRSRTTFENAIFSREMVEPKPGERWLLVTSAWHMPRAVGVFRKAGFEVTPYPVDYRTGGPSEAFKPFAFVSDGLRRLDVATKEWAGLIGYHYTGRTSELFPGPSSPAD
ncbi:YdcF family protein [Microvirga pudoricolor]|uniref:YdcF family protein n=1 Tax=Microvirga pudoricolor TaxID=2778729 RepID=UPI00194FBE8E|nr:YdcF family protein [Microvirga pudoricolor]MBM6596429.1 YdcF family protein [Microvirga pudoricolor]